MTTVDTEDPRLHEALYSNATRALGHLHWFLLHATEKLESLVCEHRPVNDFAGMTLTQTFITDLGPVAGLDPIRWWVSQGETNLESLATRTDVSYGAAQRLFKAAELQKNAIDALPRSYDDLLAAVRLFADRHAADIRTLLTYAEDLHAKDELAPAILFSHDVWGSTRQSDRMIPLDGRLPDDRDLNDALTEIACGFRDRTMYAIDRARCDRLGDLADAFPEEVLSVEDEDLFPQASHEVFDEFMTYFLMLRDSLRRIHSAIEQQRNVEQLLYDEAFWRAVIEKTRHATRAEEPTWDLKVALPFWGCPKKDRENAKRKFSEQVAAFANATGGVFIVGINDTSRAIIGVEELEDKRKFTREVLDAAFTRSGFVVMQQVVMANDAGEDRVCLIVVVAQTADAIVMQTAEGDPYCPVRKETGLARVAVSQIEEEKEAVRVTNYRFMTNLHTWVGADGV